VDLSARHALSDKRRMGGGSRHELNAVALARSHRLMRRNGHLLQVESETISTGGVFRLPRRLVITGRNAEEGEMAVKDEIKFFKSNSLRTSARIGRNADSPI